MKTAKQILLKCLFLLLLCAHVGHLHAETSQIIINDCANNLLMVEALPDDRNVGLQADVGATVVGQGITVELKGADTTLTADLNNTTITFSNVAPGVWTLCSQPEVVSFKNIKIITGETLALPISLATTVVSGASVGGLISILAIGLTEDDNGPISPFE